ncbi:MAG TPA: phosphopantothenoylcysteine decarboxylase [Spirochaetota bacterium]|nr:phosphopantothenoylcysteine decarboxylase [Spirochaetota bacterium]
MKKHVPSSEYKFVITGGPTREWIDPVRFISNPSSGKMGVALTNAAAEISRNVLFIHGPMHPSDYSSVKVPMIGIETTIQMRDAVIESLSPHTILIMSAAPADYSPSMMSDRKIKKGKSTLTIELIKTPDILSDIMELRKHDPSIEPLFITGFAAETHNIEEYAKEKITRKNLDIICVNDVTVEGAGFGVNTNIITIYDSTGNKAVFPKMTKDKIAEEIIKAICFKIDGV